MSSGDFKEFLISCGNQADTQLKTELYAKDFADPDSRWYEHHPTHIRELLYYYTNAAEHATHYAVENNGLRRRMSEVKKHLDEDLEDAELRADLDCDFDYMPVNLKGGRDKVAVQRYCMRTVHKSIKRYERCVRNLWSPVVY